MKRKEPSANGRRAYLWQNGLCITYLLIFKKFRDFLKANGWEIVDEPSEADVIIVGACGSFVPVIDDYFSHVNKFQRECKRLVVYGCLPRITPKRCQEHHSGAYLYIPPENPQIIEELISDAKVGWAQIPNDGEFRREDYRNYDPLRRYVTIQYGCSAECTYCPHVKGIGKNISRSRAEVMSEIKAMLEAGAKTIFLEGRDIGSWGIDLKPKETFPQLLAEILRLPGDFEVYINQFSANFAIQYGKELFDLLKNPKIKDVHIPIQTTSPRILKLMGRDQNVRVLGPYLKDLRRKEHLMLRTDLIIGFPTETEEELNDTLEFVSKHFDEAACHGFELHPNTEVMNMGLPFYEKGVIEERVERAREVLRGGNLVTHRGGQVFNTMQERENAIKRRRGKK
jgi:MiaB/RimO family radical SAM methylthiotransferase